MVEIEGNESSPAYLAESILDRALYQDARQWIGPTAQSLDQIDLVAVKGFYRDYYAPCHSWVGVIGPAGLEPTTTLLRSVSRDWKGCQATEAIALQESNTEGRAVYLVNQPLKQVYLRMGGLNVYRTSPDYPSSLVLNRIVGGIPGGRLWQALRQNHGSTYDVRSSLTALKYLHHFAISVSVAPEGVRDSVQAIQQQLDLLRAHPPSVEETESAKASLLGEFLRTLESSGEILGLVMTRYLYGLPHDYWRSYAKGLMAVSPESVHAAAIQYLNPEHMQVVAVGNGAILRSQLESLGTIHEVELHVASRK
jgi:zinc protease